MLPVLPPALSLPLLALLVWYFLTVGRKKNLPTWPSTLVIGSSALRSLLKAKTARKVQALEVNLVPSVAVDTEKLAALLQAANFGTTSTEDVPLLFPIAQSFRLNLALMFLPEFPVGVVGSVLARTKSITYRALHTDEPLQYRCSLDPATRNTEKGDLELDLVNTATDPSTGGVVWSNRLTVIVLNPKRKRGPAGGVKAAADAEPWQRVEEWRLGADAGRQYAAINGDLNPIHLHPLTSRLFGFQRPIAHALFLLTKAEACLRRQGVVPAYPTVLEAEFKRPTLLPAKLQCSWQAASSEAAASAATTEGGLPFAVLTGDAQKEVLVGRWRCTASAATS